jgi:hypothetical protein
MINPHWELDSSILLNRVSVERFTEKLLLFVFWGVALFLLYLTMVPSRKI